MKKHTLSHLKGILSNGKVIYFSFIDESKHIIDIAFRRLDVIKSTKGKYARERYVLTVEKHLPPSQKLLIDDRLEFDSVEDIISYIVANKLARREDILKDEA